MAWLDVKENRGRLLRAVYNHDMSGSAHIPVRKQWKKALCYLFSVGGGQREPSRTEQSLQEAKGPTIKEAAEYLLGNSNNNHGNSRWEQMAAASSSETARVAREIYRLGEQSPGNNLERVKALQSQLVLSLGSGDFADTFYQGRAPGGLLSDSDKTLLKKDFLNFSRDQIKRIYASNDVGSAINELCSLNNIGGHEEAKVTALFNRIFQAGKFTENAKIPIIAFCAEQVLLWAQSPQDARDFLTASGSYSERDLLRPFDNALADAIRVPLFSLIPRADRMGTKRTETSGHPVAPGQAFSPEGQLDHGLKNDIEELGALFRDSVDAVIASLKATDEKAIKEGLYGDAIADQVNDDQYRAIARRIVIGAMHDNTAGSTIAARHQFLQGQRPHNLVKLRHWAYEGGLKLQDLDLSGIMNNKVESGDYGDLKRICDASHLTEGQLRYIFIANASVFTEAGALGDLIGPMLLPEEDREREYAFNSRVVHDNGVTTYPLSPEQLSSDAAETVFQYYIGQVSNTLDEVVAACNQYQNLFGGNPTEDEIVGYWCLRNNNISSFRSDLILPFASFTSEKRGRYSQQGKQLLEAKQQLEALNAKQFDGNGAAPVLLAPALLRVAQNRFSAERQREAFKSAFVDIYMMSELSSSSNASDENQRSAAKEFANDCIAYVDGKFFLSSPANRLRSQPPHFKEQVADLLASARKNKKGSDSNKSSANCLKEEADARLFVLDQSVDVDQNVTASRKLVFDYVMQRPRLDNPTDEEKEFVRSGLLYLAKSELDLLGQGEAMDVAAQYDGQQQGQSPADLKFPGSGISRKGTGFGPSVADSIKKLANQNRGITVVSFPQIVIDPDQNKKLRVFLDGNPLFVSVESSESDDSEENSSSCQVRLDQRGAATMSSFDFLDDQARKNYAEVWLTAARAVAGPGNNEFEFTGALLDDVGMAFNLLQDIAGAGLNNDWNGPQITLKVSQGLLKQANGDLGGKLSNVGIKLESNKAKSQAKAPKASNVHDAKNGTVDNNRGTTAMQGCQPGLLGGEGRGGESAKDEFDRTNQPGGA